MIHGWLDTQAGFPPTLHVHGGPLSGRTWATLGALLHSLATASIGREHYRIWCSNLDALFFLAREEGLDPAFSVIPGMGVTGLDVSRRVQIRHARQMLPDAVLERIDANGGDAAEGCVAVLETVAALESVLGVDAGAGIGAATTRALFGGRWMPRWTQWPKDAPPEWRQLARDAYHGGLSAVLAHEGLVTHGAAHPGAIWETEHAHELPPGWQLLEVDRDSAYAADACGTLPDPMGPTVTDPGALLDCEGGALIDCHVDLSAFTAYAFPVRVQITPDITRSIPVRAGRWRGVWASEVLRWAIGRGAVVEPLGGVGWTRGAKFLGPVMSVLWTKKHETTGIAREAFKAAIQRCVGRLGRRNYDNVTLTGQAALDEIRAPHDWPVRWSRVHGWSERPAVFSANRMEAIDAEPMGTMPPWPSFVVGLAWAEACEHMERCTQAGAWPLYVDTDGVTLATPPGADLAHGAGMGAWRVKRTFTGAEHRAPRQFVRMDEVGREVTQYAGVPRKDQRAALLGEYSPRDAPSAMIALQAPFRQYADRLAPVLDVTRAGVERARRIGRRFTEREDHHGF